MKTSPTCLGIVALTLLSLTIWSGEPLKPATPSKPKLALSIQPRHVTDALRAVILSDREVYSQLVTAHESAPTRLGLDKPPAGSQPMPSPCEMLRLGSQATASKGVDFSYVLRSLNPINKRNAPETEVETKGLQFVDTRPDLTYSSEELLGGRWYFTAVYPDVALNQSCVTCHNRQNPQGKQFKVGEVMGALVIRIALEL